jgi:hypothetical protein
MLAVLLDVDIGMKVILDAGIPGLRAGEQRQVAVVAVVVGISTARRPTRTTRRSSRRSSWRPDERHE